MKKNWNEKYNRRAKSVRWKLLLICFMKEMLSIKTSKMYYVLLDRWLAVNTSAALIKAEPNPTFSIKLMNK